MEEDNNIIWEDSSKVLELIRCNVNSIYNIYYGELTEEEQEKILKIFNILNKN